MSAPISPDEIAYLENEAICMRANIIPHSVLKVGRHLRELLRSHEYFQAELEDALGEVRRLRLHVRVTAAHYGALDIAVQQEHLETDATARGLRCAAFCAPTSSVFVTHRMSREGRETMYPFRDATDAVKSVCDYANAIAHEHDVAALDVLDALAEQARADR